MKEKSSVGKSFPSFLIKTQSQTISNTSLKGKAVFINFWFANCTPCIREFEALNQLYRKFGDKKDFEFISFTFEKPEVVQRIRLKYNIPYKIFSVSEAECRRLMQGLGFPTSYVVSKNGIVKQIISGGESTQEEATRMIMTKIYPAILQELWLQSTRFFCTGGFIPIISFNSLLNVITLTRQ